MPPCSVACPRCAHRFTAELEASLALPPTGGDYDWCEGRESHDCPRCRAHLGVLVRVWLDDRRVEVRGIEVLPPHPVPGVPCGLAVSPGACCCRLDREALLIGADRGSGCGLWRLDPVTLRAAPPLLLPSSLFQDYASLQDVLAPDPEHVLVSTSSSVARVRAAAGDQGQGQIEARFAPGDLARQLPARAPASARLQSPRSTPSHTSAA